MVGGVPAVDIVEEPARLSVTHLIVRGCQLHAFLIARARASVFFFFFKVHGTFFDEAPPTFFAAAKNRPPGGSSFVS